MLEVHLQLERMHCCCCRHCCHRHYCFESQYVINFVFSIGKQPYREAINFVSYVHVVYSYNDVTTHIYMRTNYLRHLANIIEWSRPVGGGGGGWGPTPNCIG